MLDSRYELDYKYIPFWIKFYSTIFAIKNGPDCRDFMPFVRNLFRIIFNILESFLDSDSKVGFISLANYTTLAIRILQNFPIFFQSPDSKNFRREKNLVQIKYFGLEPLIVLFRIVLLLFLQSPICAHIYKPTRSVTQFLAIRIASTSQIRRVCKYNKKRRIQDSMQICRRWITIVSHSAQFNGHSAHNGISL